MLNIESSLL